MEIDYSRRDYQHRDYFELQALDEEIEYDEKIEEIEENHSAELKSLENEGRSHSEALDIILNNLEEDMFLRNYDPGDLDPGEDEVTP